LSPRVVKCAMRCWDIFAAAWPWPRSSPARGRCGVRIVGRDRGYGGNRWPCPRCGATTTQGGLPPHPGGGRKPWHTHPALRWCCGLCDSHRADIAKLFCRRLYSGIIAATRLHRGNSHLRCACYPGHGPAQPRHSRAELLGAWSTYGRWRRFSSSCSAAIYGGIFTPTEGAAVGAACTFFTRSPRAELNADALPLLLPARRRPPRHDLHDFPRADMLNSRWRCRKCRPTAHVVSSLGWPPL